MADMKANREDKSTWLARAREVLAGEARAVETTCGAIGDGFADAVALMASALGRGGRIAMSGIGKNVPIAEKIAATLNSTGSRSLFLNPVQALHGDLGMVAPEDVVVALSFSGESAEVLRVIPYLKKSGIATVAMTGRRDSTLARECDATLHVAVESECDPFNMAPTASTTATLALGDAVAMVLLDIGGFGRDDYARFHPAGAIGQALLTRATDVMRPADRLALLPPSATIRDALVSMTRARAGAAYVIDTAGRLLGIFTDGDLRRYLAKENSDISRQMGEVMTMNPVAVGDDKMATDVLRVFREHSIDDIAVVDADGRLVGAIDISDLPKLKVM